MKEYSDPAIEAELRHLAETEGYNGWLGLEVIAAGNGRIETRIKIRSELTRDNGFVHGAVVGALADTSCAWAARSVKGDVVTSTYTIQFLAPSLGSYLNCEAKVLKAGKRNASVESHIYSESAEGEIKLVATALALITAI